MYELGEAGDAAFPALYVCEPWVFFFMVAVLIGSVYMNGWANDEL